jgi:hypothetical protein
VLLGLWDSHICMNEFYILGVFLIMRKVWMGCVCVCVRERERERERGLTICLCMNGFHNVRGVVIWRGKSCIKRERERVDNLHMYEWVLQC